MSFIDQKAVSAAIFRKVPAQISLRIKNVIVIADNGIDPDRYIQGSSKGHT